MYWPIIGSEAGFSKSMEGNSGVRASPYIRDVMATGPTHSWSDEARNVWITTGTSAAFIERGGGRGPVLTV